jgi:uncharacterized protein DUF4157/lysine-specific metallo-endopeptidase family protein
MRTFAQKTKATQQTLSAKPKATGREYVGQSHEVNSILHLQRTIGNQAVQRMLHTHNEEVNAGLTSTALPHYGHDFARIPVYPPKAVTLQTKLAINKPGDEYEQEADRLAEQVMRMPVGCSCHDEVRRQVDHERDEDEIQRAASGASVSRPLSAGEIRGLGVGTPLATDTRRFFEPRLGADLSGVRVHAGDRAGDMARRVGARAFTYRQDIVFAPGEYRPQTSEGRRLLAHELAHTLQHRRADDDSVKRYSTQDCTLQNRSEIRPADAQARQLVRNAIAALGPPRSRQSAPLSQRVSRLMNDHFGSSSEDTIRAVQGRLWSIRDKFLDNDYQYECEDDCDTENAYVYDLWTDVHLCMNKLGGRPTDFVAGVIVHEMSHYAAGTEDHEYYFPGGTRTSLSTSDAVDNADCYEGFVRSL